MIIKHGADGDFVDGWTLPSTVGSGVDGSDKQSAKKDHKGRYYYEKLNLTPVDIDEHLAFRKSYIEGLIWCLAYYYRGCISWGWYFPYHYGPLISDLTNLPEVFASINFEEGKPLQPFQQLMGCLPPASATIVPKPYRKLMCSPTSPISQFYPTEFEVDMNGKKNPWEGVNILPFIDVNLLKKCINEHCPDSLLSTEERRRNSRGKVFVYSYDAAVMDVVPSFNRDIGITDITKCHSRVETIDAFSVTTISFEPKLIPGTKIPSPGFPSLNVLPIQSVDLMPLGLNCFGSASKYPNTLLTLQSMPELPGAEQLADTILGKHLYINWPMMHEAKVVAISDSKCIVKIVKKKKNVKMFQPAEMQRWVEESETLKEQYKTGAGVPGTGGVDIGEIQIRLKLLPLQGMKTSFTNGAKKKVFGTVEADVPLQMVLWQSPAPDPRFEERGPATLQDRFPAKSSVVLTKGKYRGCTGSVVGIVDNDKVGVRVQVTPPEPPFGLAIARSVQESYVSFSDASKVLKLHPAILGKIVGSLFFNPGRYDIGLNLKYKHEFCVNGYSRRRRKFKKGESKKNTDSTKKAAWGTVDTVLVVGNDRSDTPNNSSSMNNNNNKGNFIWEYTPKAIRLIAAFKQQFPKVFQVISKNPNERSYEARALGPNGTEELKKIREWLNSIETAKIPRTPCTTESMPTAAVTSVQRAADVRTAAQEQQGNPKEINIKIPPSAMYREGSITATDVLHLSDSEAPELGDRIVNLCANGLSFGARGTVVGIHNEKTGCVEVVMDKEFIGGSSLQGSCAQFRGKLCVWNHLLKVTPSNSKDVIDQMIPVGSGKAAIEKFVSVSQKNEPATTRKREKTPVKASTPDSSIDSSSKSRGDKQAGWREAKGPPSSGIGFDKGHRSVRNGLQSWRKMIKEKPKQVTAQHATNQNGNIQATAGLKAMLGVSNGAGTSQAGVNDTSTVAGLKNILGIAPAAVTEQGTGTPANLVATPPPPTPGNAADALLRMMTQGPSNPPPHTISQQPQISSGFNFTYVKEGEAHATSSMPNTIMTHQPSVPPLYHHPMPMAPMMSVSEPSQDSMPIPLNRGNVIERENSPSLLVPATLAVKSKR